MSSYSNTNDDKVFGPIRSCVWPVHRNEVRKLLPMLAIVFLLCFNYSILRNMKDTVVVTASGAEVIPFIKVWVMLPMAVLLTALFAKLSNHYSQERVFYYIISGFLACFALFAFVLYPLRDVLHPNAAADALELVMPVGFKGLISTFRNWTFTGFYVMSELWGSLVLNVLFWGFANEVTRIGEARRFYGVLGIGSNLATILAGQVAIFLSQPRILNRLPFLSGREEWEQSQMVLITTVLIGGLIVMGLFRWMNKKVLNDPSFEEFHHNKREIKAKGILSFRESFSYLSNSRYLIYIAIIVVAYNLVINLVEVVWKDQLRQLYPNPGDFNTYMNNLTSAIGVIALVSALFMSKIIDKLGWTWTALITPIIMLITCAGFFSFILFSDSLGSIVVAFTGLTPLVIAVFFGGAQNCLSKAAKYSVFDTTKEMAYIPLSHESKLKGKAAIDGVGSRFGKSGGSLIHQGLLMIFATLSASAPYVAVILLLVIAFWIHAARRLGTQFNELVVLQNVASELHDAPEKAKAELVGNQIPAVS
ncbi:MAG: NTP/NDP exchange transporter [Parachlamydiaceae bacterium]|nr:NTP/NDP exchange transporter [Parachlamydiaceae bacterium]